MEVLYKAKKTIKHCGFEAPTYGVRIPREYKTVTDENGIVHIYAPKGADIPEELKPYVEEENA